MATPSTPASERPQIRLYKDVKNIPLVPIREGVAAYDMGTAAPCPLEYTAGIFDKTAEGPELVSPHFKVYEWKLILEGEWHIIPDDGTDRKIVAKVGDLVYMPMGCAFRSLSVPFKAFFVTSRGVRAPLEHEQKWE